MGGAGAVEHAFVRRQTHRQKGARGLRHNRWHHMTELQSHERLAPHTFPEILPSAAGSDIHALADDIRRNGLREPITLYEDKLLDGRARFLSDDTSTKVSAQ